MKQFLQVNEGSRRALLIVYKATIPANAQLAVDPREVCEVGWFTKYKIASLKLFPEYKEALEKFFA